MSLEIYKRSQGYWTRVLSAVALGAMVLMGAVWLWDLLRTVRIGSLQPIYLQAGAAILVIAVVGAIGYYFIAVKTASVEFLIATEGEMKKVNWSTRRELIGSTWIVICFMVMLGLFNYLVDLGFFTLFQSMNVVQFSR